MIVLLITILSITGFEGVKGIQEEIVAVLILKTVVFVDLAEDKLVVLSEIC